MLDLSVIDNTIEELENSETTFAVCDKLADLYIVKKELIKQMEDDPVPDSKVDEEIPDIQALFIAYANDRTTENLDKMLDEMKNVISEIYHSCEDAGKDRVRMFISNLETILTPTIIESR